MLKLFEATQVSKFVVTNVSGIYLRFFVRVAIK